MRRHSLIAWGIGTVVSLTGCDDSSNVTRPTAPPPPSAATAASPSTTPTTPTSAPATSAQAAAPEPEDVIMDAAREAPVRARAKELNAVPVRDTKNRKAGDELVVLVRGDKNAGGIYGGGPYTADSAIRKAVVHAGAAAQGELVLVWAKYFQNDQPHPSVPANDVKPNAWGKYHLSYTVEKIEVP
jgi:hypothetical protein